MLVKYEHRCSLDWLKARQSCLTASDVKDLLPVTRTGRPRKVTEADYLKVFARKAVDLGEDDCLSTGVMARGHILEPYAIDMYNQVFVNGDARTLYHWDDVVVKELSRGHLGLAFSPDACDVPFAGGSVTFDVRSRYSPITEIGEVKSYNPSAHLIAGNTDKAELEERWQIAVAMAVLPSIERARLIFFNPALREESMFLVTYERADLLNEIETVLEVEASWLDFVDNYDQDSPVNESAVRTMTEEEICRLEMAKARLNP